MARPQVADVRSVPCHHGMARSQVTDVRSVPCHHGMACSQVADGGDSLQVWRVAANVLNEQSRTSDKGWSCSLGFGRDDKNSSLQKKTQASYGRSQEAPYLDGFFG
jgi:hypothetical protein